MVRAINVKVVVVEEVTTVVVVVDHTLALAAVGVEVVHLTQSEQLLV